MTSAAYGVGAGSIAVLSGLAGEGLGFRGVFALAAIPLVAVPVAGRLLTEPDRFTHRTRVAAAGHTAVLPVLGTVPTSDGPVWRFWRRSRLTMAGWPGTASYS
jgi:hypothetical protein